MQVLCDFNNKLNILFGINAWAVNVLVAEYKMINKASYCIDFYVFKLISYSVSLVKCKYMSILLYMNYNYIFCMHASSGSVKR